LGFGVWGLGFGVWAPTPNPQSPIPNPQSPIPIKIRKKIIILLINNFKTKLNNNLIKIN
jgi:hypothetical protein